MPVKIEPHPGVLIDSLEGYNTLKQALPDKGKLANYYSDARVYFPDRGTMTTYATRGKYPDAITLDEYLVDHTTEWDL